MVPLSIAGSDFLAMGIAAKLADELGEGRLANSLALYLPVNDDARDPADPAKCPIHQETHHFALVHNTIGGELLKF